MTKNRTQLAILLATFLVVLATLACGGGAADAPPATEDAPAAEAPDAAEPATEEPDAEDVAYEPAYPTDVSEEGLSDEDLAQQDTGHEHGGEGHAHGEDTHTHGEDDAHDDHEH